MSLSKKLYSSLILILVFACPALAQEVKEISLEHTNVIEVKNIPSDTLSTGTAVVKQMELLESTNVINDNTLSIVEVGNKKVYDLKDMQAAAKYDSLWMKELHESVSLYEEMYDEVINLEIDTIVDNTINTDTLKMRLERLNQKTPFNIAYNPSLENVIKSFLVRKRGLIERMLTTSQFYFPLFEEHLDNNDVPLEMKYLAIVESALNPRARSRVGAKGLWQFMYSTGKMYKLDVSSYVDERSDPIKSTEAACKYLSKLHEIFDDWDLALAAYNSGPGNVNKAIRRSGGYKNYWNIRRNLPRETAGYVPAFLATMYLFEYAEEHGIKTRKVDRTYFETDTIHVKSLITFDQISKLVGVGVEELKILNPSYKLNIIPYVKGKNYSLRLPKLAMGKFVSNEEAIYSHVNEQLKRKESPLPQLVKANDRIRYKVRSGDYLGKIAEKYGVGISQIKRWNGLRSNNLRIGQRLTIYPRKPYIASKTSLNAAVNKGVAGGSKVHTVQSGDSLWTISKKYPGISIENLREWNGISGNNIKPGAKLKLCDCSS
jgi:membrane-bound lytic murein transglycosylase D